MTVIELIEQAETNLWAAKDLLESADQATDAVRFKFQQSALKNLSEARQNAFQAESSLTTEIINGKAPA